MTSAERLGLFRAAQYWSIPNGLHASGDGNLAELRSCRLVEVNPATTTR